MVDNVLIPIGVIIWNLHATLMQTFVHSNVAAKLSCISIVCFLILHA